VREKKTRKEREREEEGKMVIPNFYYGFFLKNKNKKIAICKGS
jgi:hypothetical protein